MVAGQFPKHPQVGLLPEAARNAIEVVGNVLPFKANNYVVDELIDWSNYENDPIFNLIFPNRDMLLPGHYQEMEAALQTGDRNHAKAVSHQIRLQLNPHPAAQVELNVPSIDGVKLTGIQHKYRETLLFFPSSGQTCHSYCTFCFRWPQFVGMNEIKFAMRETELLVRYLEAHQEVTDILFTGGDPMIMKFEVFKQYIAPFLDRKNKTNIQSIRIGTKSLGFWPYKFTMDEEADKFLELFEEIVKSGINLAFMAHFNHPSELRTPAVHEAIRRLRNTGLQIRTQSPLLRHINDDPIVWAEMWREQVNQNCIPYYMFIARNTGAKHYFEVPLVRAWQIFREAYQQVSGLCRTVRGPSMSATPGKIQILGEASVGEEKVLALRFLQARNPNWVGRPFFAKFDKTASWLTDLSPAFDEEFFYAAELREMYAEAMLNQANTNAIIN
ncbi:MAG: lysine 2,3-aminomutase [Lewinellaceae bacterium]|nr:lysine 2,3-aminomutase [Lewinellaceae bacterium]